MSSTARSLRNSPGRAHLQAQRIAIEPCGLVAVADRQPDAHFDDVRGGGRLGRGQRIGLVQLDEVAVWILHDHRPRLRARRYRNRRAASRDHRRAELLQPRERGVEIADDGDQRECAAVLNLAIERLAFGLRDLHHLDAGAHAARAADQPAQLRVGQAEHVAQRRVGVGIGRRPLHVQAEAVAIERHCLLQVGRDRAEEVARPDDQPSWCRPCRRGRALREHGAGTGQQHRSDGHVSHGTLLRTGSPHNSKAETAIQPPTGGGGCFSTARPSVHAPLPGMTSKQPTSSTRLRSGF